MDCPPKKVAVIKSPERDGRCGSGRSWRLVHYKFRQLIFFYDTPWTARAIMALDGQLLQLGQFFYEKVRHD